MPWVAKVLTCVFPAEAATVDGMNTSAPQPPDTPRELEQLRAVAAVLLQRMRLKSADQPSPTEAPRFYSVAQVAQMFGMSSMTVYRAIAAGEFPAVRIRGRLIVPARAVEAMAEVAVTEHTMVDAAGWVTSPGDDNPAPATRPARGCLR